MCKGLQSEDPVVQIAGVQWVRWLEFGGSSVWNFQSLVKQISGMLTIQQSEILKVHCAKFKVRCSESQMARRSGTLKV